MNAYGYTIWIFVLPFLSFLVTGLLKGRINKSLAGMIATGAIRRLRYSTGPYFGNDAGSDHYRFFHGPYL
jgi:hypothetical protein